MLKDQKIAIDSIYVPARFRATLKPERVEALALSIMEDGQKAPILVRRDGERFVLIEGFHRLEALKALGETVAIGLVVQARRE